MSDRGRAMTTIPTRVIKPGKRGRPVIAPHRIVSVPQWGEIAGLADDSTSLEIARKLLIDGDGPEVVKVGRRDGVRLRDHARWARSQPWAEYLSTVSASERDKRQAQAMSIVGDETYTAVLYDKYLASPWRFKMTFKKWLKRRERLKDRHNKGRGK